MPTNNLSPKSKNKLGIASPIPPKMSARFGSAVLPYLQSVQGLFPPTNPYGQATSNFLLGQAPQAAQQMAEGYPNVLFNTSNPLGGKRIVNPVALDMAVALPIGTALKGAGLAGGGVAATFAGIGAKTANREALLVAERMKAAGAPDEEIYKATGWFFGSADGKPRFEIPDDSSFVDIGRYVESRNPWDPYAIANMGDGFRHKKLYSAYPDLKDASFFMRTRRGYSGDYKAATSDAKEQIGVYPNSQENVLNPNTAANKSTTLHELQHAIQQREGFARGGSPEAMFYEHQAATHDRINALNDRLAEIEKSDASGLRRTAKPGFEDVYTAIKQEINNLENTRVDSFGQYRRLAGESEARLTQSRMAMTGAERAENYPPNMYDVPVGDQIVRYGEGPALATTWHGSPHKFEPTELNDLGEFNAAKIGTGEGAQAYGMGHYTAEARETAKSYQESLTNLYGTPTTIDGGGKSVPIPLWLADKIKQGGNVDTAIAEWTQRAAEQRSAMKTSVQPWIQEGNAVRLESELKDLQAIKAAGGGKVVDAGHLYKVDIPDDQIAKMLDWDKPLSEQTPEVKKILKQAGYVIDKNKTGADIVRGSRGTQSDEITSDLAAKGIPGIRYLDGGSRSGGAGTSNYVVFPGNENMMTILERNGQAMSPESQAIARYREIKGAKSVVRMEAALRTAGVPLPKNEPVAYIQSLVDRAHRRN